MGAERREAIINKAQALIQAQLHDYPQSLIVLLGPTASGKSQLALDLAPYFPLEIVSADSRLVYRGMDIGTAKPSAAELQTVPHHLIDIVDPDQDYTVANYQQAAFATIDHILAAKHLPLMVGGTMLYIDAVVKNFHLAGEPPKQISFRTWPLAQLQSHLLALQPLAPQFLDWQNPVRLTRALEYYEQTGQWLWEKKQNNESRYPALLLGLSVDRELLKKRIIRRVELQIAAGLVEEVEQLQKKYSANSQAMTGIGYRQVCRYLQGEYSLAEMKNQIIHDTFAYAKRQMTWWKRNPTITWLEVVE